MPVLKPLDAGAMFWAVRDALPRIQSLGFTSGQLGIAGDTDLKPLLDEWKAAIGTFPLVTVFCAYNGESYADIPTVQKTVGFIPESTRAEREARTLEVSDFAWAIGVPSIATHIGFVPEDRADPDYIAVREMVRRICDHAARHEQTFALETGQEPAHVLLEFFKDVDRPNLGINFDPANMILYGTGDPIEALGILAEHVISVHAKDGDWPPKGVPGALGFERPLGQGSVGMKRFVAKLKEIGYTGTMNVEREIEDLEQRYRDMKAGRELLGKLV